MNTVRTGHKPVGFPTSSSTSGLGETAHMGRRMDPTLRKLEAGAKGVLLGKKKGFKAEADGSLSGKGKVIVVSRDAKKSRKKLIRLYNDPMSVLRG